MLSGLPASGKSTRARELMEELKGENPVRVNKDLLREMMFFSEWTGSRERTIRHVERQLARQFLASGKTVIIDDTNLREGDKENWKSLAQETGRMFLHYPIDTDLNTCLERDRSRHNSVGDHVIKGMARRARIDEAFGKEEIIVDVDGTLANIEHRLHFIKGETKDYRSFFDSVDEDLPIEENIAMVQNWFVRDPDNRRVILVSGRSDECRDKTEWWLKEQDVPYYLLIMRQAGDHRPDDQLKQMILDNFFRKELIQLVMDDRPSVIRMWESNDLNVIDVGNGVEF